jgi:phage gp29-like protein
MKKYSEIQSSRVKLAVQTLLNPLRNLSYSRLVNSLEQFHAGYLSAAATLWEAMERRDPVLCSLASKRKKAVARLPWEILTIEDSPEAARQKEVLLYFYNHLRATTVLEQNESGGLSLLIRHMMDAVGKKFAVHEVVWTLGPDGVKANFRFCPLWWFENKTGSLRFLSQDFATDGEEMQEGAWLVTVGEGIMESCSVINTLKSFPLKDWATYSEKFGLPGVLGKTSAAVDSPEWEAMEKAVESLMNDWAAVASNTDQIELIETKGGTANLPFPPLVEYCDRAMAVLWRGADLSTLSQGQAGVGASLQGDETDLLLEDDAQRISETLNEQVDKFVLRYAFGRDVERLAYIKILPPSKDQFDKEIKIDDFMIRNQIPLSLSALYERYGRAQPAPADAIIRQPVQPQPRELANVRERTLSAMAGVGEFKQRALPALAQSTRDALKPVASKLQAIYLISDQGEQRKALEQLLKEIPALQTSINADPKNLQPIMDAMTTAYINGRSMAKESRIVPDLLTNDEDRVITSGIAPGSQSGRRVALTNDEGPWWSRFNIRHYLENISEWLWK